MRASFVVVALLGASASASASILPRQIAPCATECIASAPLGNCQGTDNGCLCRNQEFVRNTTTCIMTACTGPDLDQAIAVSQEMCRSVGVDLASSTEAGPSAGTTSPTSNSTGASTSPQPTGSQGSGAISHGISGAILAVVALAALVV